MHICRITRRSRTWLVAMMLCAFVGMSTGGGCQSLGERLRHPFRKKPPETTETTPNYDAPGQSIQKASFDQPATPGSELAKSPGSSLEGVEEKKGFWQKVGDATNSKNINRRWKSMTGRAANEQIARQAYADGMAAFKDHRYEEAAKKFDIAADRWSDSELEEDGMFMYAESMFFADRYPKASDTYTKLLKKYENSRYLDKVMVRSFAIGRYWDDVSRDKSTYQPNFTDNSRPFIDTQGHAISVFEGIRMNDPTGPLADDATFAAGVSHFMRGYYDDADHDFDTLRKEYPRSEHQPAAHLLGLRTKLRTYQGPQYDDRPLTDADKLIDSTLLQFGQEMPEERERLQHAKRAIRAQRAEREYDNAVYYDSRKCYGAARYYYQNVIKQYPETHHGELAQKRMVEIKDKPADPPNYWWWLAKIFGERSRKATY
ncbi:MAG TPA: outer membrane protein assembly factor BamD [Pirellulales bacterium]|jgi:outer membrane protein assembly factor BamD (BamD/ComL family)|nr:outer membrane protein assembly factor BamD [Pirellulales bacterium]